MNKTFGKIYHSFTSRLPRCIGRILDLLLKLMREEIIPLTIGV